MLTPPTPTLTEGIREDENDVNYTLWPSQLPDQGDFGPSLHQDINISCRNNGVLCRSTAPENVFSLSLIDLHYLLLQRAQVDPKQGRQTCLHHNFISIGICVRVQNNSIPFTSLLGIISFYLLEHINILCFGSQLADGLLLSFQVVLQSLSPFPLDFQVCLHLQPRETRNISNETAQDFQYFKCFVLNQLI